MKNKPLITIDGMPCELSFVVDNPPPQKMMCPKCKKEMIRIEKSSILHNLLDEKWKEEKDLSKYVYYVCQACEIILSQE